MVLLLLLLLLLQLQDGTKTGYGDQLKWADLYGPNGWCNADTLADLKMSS